MTIETPGTAELFVNGESVPLTAGPRAWTARLPEPASTNRTAALRIKSIVGYERGAALTAPITFGMGPGQMSLGSWDELGLPHYAGGIRYSTQVDVPAKRSAEITLDLGRVRGVAEAWINGVRCGVRLWHPYRFDISTAAKVGRNEIEIRVYNTLGPHYGVGHPSAHVYENQTRSGILGPVEVTVAEEVELELTREVF